jgi:hypothetical protein
MLQMGATGIQEELVPVIINIQPLRKITLGRSRYRLGIILKYIFKK